MIRNSISLILLCLAAACAPTLQPTPPDEVPCARPADGDPIDGGFGGTGKDQEACAPASPPE